jgi:hypothetical protein
LQHVATVLFFFLGAFRNIRFFLQRYSLSLCHTLSSAKDVKEEDLEALEEEVRLCPCRAHCVAKGIAQKG